MPDRKDVNDVLIAYLREDITGIKKTIEAIDAKLSDHYVTRREIDEYRGDNDKRVARLERVIYGIFAVIGLEVLYALLSLVIIKH